MLEIKENVSLAEYSTMRLGGPARYFTKVTMPGQLAEAVEWARDNNAPWQVIGGGSNIIVTDKGFEGLIIFNAIKGVAFVAKDKYTILQAGAGENWDSVVRQASERQLHGIAELSLIPGTVGATPVQNVGAYGREVSEIISSVEAYDSHTKSWVTLSPEDCGFAYRSSIFNGSERGRYAIASVVYHLPHKAKAAPTYESLAEYLKQYNITEHDPLTIRNAVIAVRQSKLPNPDHVANTGSFFKNPIVDSQTAAPLLGANPKAPHFHLPDGRIKLLAGWLIDQTGLKGYADRGLKIYRKNALVIVNESAESYADLATFRDDIVLRVKDFSGITLEQEPEIVG